MRWTYIGATIAFAGVALQLARLWLDQWVGWLGLGLSIVGFIIVRVETRRLRAASRRRVRK